MNVQRRENNIRQMAEEFRQQMENEKKKRKNYVLLPKTTRSQSKRCLAVLFSFCVFVLFF